MFFDIGIGIHIQSQLNMFRFVDNISSKMKVFPVSEMLGGRNFMHTWTPSTAGAMSADTFAYSWFSIHSRIGFVNDH
jgi:hypothetical protein